MRPQRFRSIRALFVASLFAVTLIGAATETHAAGPRLADQPHTSVVAAGPMSVVGAPAEAGPLHGGTLGLVLAALLGGIGAAALAARRAAHLLAPRPARARIAVRYAGRAPPRR